MSYFSLPGLKEKNILDIVLQENRTPNVPSVDTPYLSQEGRVKAKISASPRPDSSKSWSLGTPLGLGVPQMPQVPEEDAATSTKFWEEGE